MSKLKNDVDMTQIYTALNKLGNKMDRVVNKAVNEATPTAEKTLKKNTPYFDGKKYAQKNKASYSKEHMRDHIISSKASKGYADVGFDDSVSWRVHFVEFGTIKQKPDAFIAKTMKEIESEVSSIIQHTLQRELLK